jgi:hypothetical protein
VRECLLERGGGVGEITGDVLGGVLIALVQFGSFINSTGGSDSAWRGFLGRVAGASGKVNSMWTSRTNELTLLFFKQNTPLSSKLLAIW